MPQYKYSAVSKDGNKVTGVIDGFNELDAASKIKASYAIVLQISEAQEASKAAALLNVDLGANKLDTKAFTLMCRQFSVILKAGVPIRRAVELIADKMENKPLKNLLEQVAEDVDGGRSLATSFEERGKKLLPVTFLETVRAGEEAGSLDTSFESISEHYEKESKMKGKVKGALVYPAFVMVVAVIVVIVLMVKVVPTFTSMFAEMDQELPLPTQLLIAMSEFFRDNWLIIAVVGLALFTAFKIYGSTETGKLNLAKLQLKLPVLGNVAVLNSASQFANTMTMMLSAGLPMTKAVEITSRVLDNYFISLQIGKITERLEEGQTLGRSIREAACLPDILVDMTGVGEESGELEQTLRMTASYYDNELEQATAAAVAKLEPTVLVFLAGFAGFIVIAIYMAMFGMYSGM